MVSDDTEHSLLTAQALLKSNRNPEAFQRLLAWGLRGWLLGLPAGIGLATLRSTLRLWIGVPAHRAGVNSAGNGAAMRAAILGCFFANDLKTLVEFCDRSSVITHLDPRAILGARVVAIAARSATLGQSNSEFLEEGRAAVKDSSDWTEMLEVIQKSLDEEISVSAFALRIGCKKGVSGFVMQSIPVAIYAWLIHRNDFEVALRETILVGGDTDTTAAIVGGICGSESQIPDELLKGLFEWPRTVSWMSQLAINLAEDTGPLRVAWPLIPVRNAIFTTTVLYHGFRRLL